MSPQDKDGDVIRKIFLQTGRTEDGRLILLYPPDKLWGGGRWEILTKEQEEQWGKEQCIHMHEASPALTSEERRHCEN